MAECSKRYDVQAEECAPNQAGTTTGSGELPPREPARVPPLVLHDTSSEHGAPEQWKRIGRYRVIKVLGQGAFGRVFLAHDDELNRPVAIKVAHRERIACLQDVDLYVAEGRVLASLDHPNIVPVHDVGRTEDG